MTDAQPTLGFLIHEVARLMRKRFEQNARDCGLTRSQWQVIVNLAKNEGIHQAALADMLEIEPITLVRILDKLAARGLIERRQHETDRRIWLLFLTNAAHPIIADMQPMAEVTRSEALLGVSAEDRVRLFDILNLMKSNLLTASRAPAAEKEVRYV